MWTWKHCGPREAVVHGNPELDSCALVARSGHQEVLKRLRERLCGPLRAGSKTC
jgi:hypothetical protein